MKSPGGDSILGEKQTSGGIDEVIENKKERTATKTWEPKRRTAYLFSHTTQIPQGLNTQSKVS